MGSQERRRKLTIDEINEYWRRLKQGTERPNLHRVCNAIRVLDAALTESGPEMNKQLSTQDWSRIRNDCFDILVSSFPGFFQIFESLDLPPLDAGSKWPANGYLEFYPDQLNRRDDACHANLNEVHEAIALRLRWGFAEGRQNVTPEDFANFSEINEKLKNTAEEHEAQTSLNRIYEACAHEASKLKKIAHRKWWQLHYLASSCSDHHQKLHLRKQMDALELVWGRSQ